MGQQNVPVSSLVAGSSIPVKVTFPPNISIEKCDRFTDRIIGVNSAAVVRNVFVMTASFSRCTVLRNDVLFVLLYTHF